MTRRRLFAALMGLPLASQLTPHPGGIVNARTMAEFQRGVAEIEACLGEEQWIREKVVGAVMQAIKGNAGGTFAKFQSLVKSGD